VSRRTVVIAVVASALLAGGYYKLLLAPKRQEAAKLAKAVAKKKSELADQQGLLATYTKARDEYRANYATLVRLGKAVPQDDDTRSLMVQLDAAANHSGVDFRTISIGTNGGNAGANANGSTGEPGANTPPPGAVSVGTAGFSALPLTFSFRGKFGDLSDFFARLQRFVDVSNNRMTITGRLLRVQSISLQPDQSGFPRIRANISASSYLLPATEGLTAGGTPGGPKAATDAGAKGGSSGGATAATTTATVTGATP
jgi:hypothetical protein